MKIFTLVSIAVIMTLMAAPGMADESRDHICFRALDKNKDGEVTLEEFEKHYKDARETFDKADENKDGKLTHDEYHDMLGHGAS